MESTARKKLLNSLILAGFYLLQLYSMDALEIIAARTYDTKYLMLSYCFCIISSVVAGIVISKIDSESGFKFGEKEHLKRLISRVVLIAIVAATAVIVIIGYDNPTASEILYYLQKNPGISFLMFHFLPLWCGIVLCA